MSIPVSQFCFTDSTVVFFAGDVCITSKSVFLGLELEKILPHPLPPGLIVEPAVRDAAHFDSKFDWKPDITAVESIPTRQRAKGKETHSVVSVDSDSLDGTLDFEDDKAGIVMGVLGDDKDKYKESDSNECVTCGKVYRHRRHLQRHQRYECGGGRPRFRCPICYQSYIRPEHLKRHGMQIHKMKISTPRHSL